MYQNMVFFHMYNPSCLLRKGEEGLWFATLYSMVALLKLKTILMSRWNMQTTQKSWIRGRAGG